MHVRQNGFSLLEILIAITIMALMAVLIVPQLGNKSGKPQELAFVAQLNRLMQTAWQQALFTGHIHKVLFDFKQRTISLEEQQAGTKGATALPFVPVSGIIDDTHMQLPEQFIVKNFFIDRQDEMRRGNRINAYFFVMPSGTTQPVIINIAHSLTDQKQPAPVFGLVLNPFSAQFEYIDEPQHP